MAEPSTKNPEKLFHFKFTPLIKLKLSIDALCDPEFNPRGDGVLEVTEKVVEITVRNLETNAAGYLRLNSTALKDFYFNSKCKDKLMRVNFRRILQTINHADNINEESIILFHFDGSDNITINLGNDPVKEYKVELLAMFTGFHKFPDIIFFCEAVIPSIVLREILDRIQTGSKNHVTVNIMKKVVSLFMGNAPPWIYTYDDKIDGTRGMSPGQNHRAWFYWPHLEMLKKATLIAPAFALCFLTRPNNMIMTRFTLRELGDLVFINEAITIIADSDDKNDEIDDSSWSEGSDFEYVS